MQERKIDLQKRPDEVISLLGRRVHAFRETLATYLIPPDAVERYTVEFMRKREEFFNRYMASRLESMGHYADTLELVAEVAFLESSPPRELNLEDLTPAAKEYLRDTLRIQIELLQKASKEYLP